MFLKKEIFVVSLLAGLFLLLNSYIVLFKYDWFLPFNLIPLVIFCLVGIFYFTEWVIFLMVFVTPLSIGLRELGITQGIDLSLPAEPLMILFSGIYLINEFIKGITPKQIFKHPITIVILLQLLWMLITTFTSQDVVISLKFLVARLWFVISGFFLMTYIFKDVSKIKTFIWMYLSALAIVCIITIIKHAEFNFHHKIADWIVSPFYNDHTAYGAALSMFIPPTFVLLFIEKSLIKRSVLFLLFALLITALVLSFARAAWMGVFVALMVLVTLFFKIKFRTLIITIVSLVIIIFSFSEQLLILMGKNKTDSEGNLYDNIVSSFNIKNDASNLERINRWNCAYRMFLDKPIFGFGPGTYQFYYAPYQLSKEKTIISTNFGSVGSSHSEYLGPLSEQGLLGMLLVFVLLLSVFSLGYNLCYSLKNKNHKLLAYGLFLGLVTYFIHGFFNFFLDTDKLSLPFWAFIAALVSLHINNNNENQSL